MPVRPGSGRAGIAEISANAKVVMRRLMLMVVTTFLAGSMATLAWSGVTHRVAYVVTNGVSMQPLYHAGDLVVLAKKDSYHVGDIVAYRAEDIIVLHRIIDGHSNAWITQGDNNESVDAPRPTTSDMLGRAVFHIPQGGTWLSRLLSPPVLSAIAFLLLIGTGKTVRRQRRRRRGTVVKSASSPSPTGLLALSTPRLRLAAGAIAFVGLFAGLLTVFVGIKPTTKTVTVQPPTDQSLTFSYGATVPLTKAYDSTKVIAPDPVFRSVADTVDVTFAYRGPPGQVEVDAELSIANGWHSTVSLLAKQPVDGAGDPETVKLDLDALAARAAAGAKATGSSGDIVNISVVPRVSTGTGQPFAPTLGLELTPLALALQDPTNPLEVDDVAPAPTKVSVPQVLGFGGTKLISVTNARILCVALLLVALFGAAVLRFYVRRATPPSEDELIHRQHGPLLIEVQPMETDRPVVEVTDFKTLKRLAERYALLIMHWTEGGSTIYMVQDDSISYRYHSGEPVVEVEEPPHWQLDTTSPMDELTDLPDLTLFENEVQYAIDAGGGPNLCLMLVNVDNLDAINDEHGRGFGDAVLVGIAERLRRAVRPTDLVARLAGDDFAVLFENVGTAAVDNVAKRVLRVAHESMMVGVELLQVQVSLGVVQGGPDVDAAALMDQARAALAEAQAENSSHYAWFAELARPDQG
jgi:signal peptidase I